MMKFLFAHFRFVKSARGYTLLELLTVMGVLGVISTIVVGVVFISLRGAKKSDVIDIMRQNGDTAMSQMVRQIRYAKSLDVPASCVPSVATNSLTITSLDTNTQTIFACSPATISSNSASLMDTNSVAVSACTFTCTQQTVDDPPSINIQFTLVPKAAGNFSETNTTIPFQSSVTMRNYER